MFTVFILHGVRYWVTLVTAVINLAVVAIVTASVTCLLIQPMVASRGVERCSPDVILTENFSQSLNSLHGCLENPHLGADFVRLWSDV